jgi:hypothetical protein
MRFKYLIKQDDELFYERNDEDDKRLGEIVKLKDSEFNGKTSILAAVMVWNFNNNIQI